MRVADYIAKRLSEVGVRYVYGIMGGGAGGLNDGFIKNNDIQYVCFHHEQGAGHAAVGESKITKKLSVVNPTTGCGGTNCLTSLLDAWQDSIPVLFISGNVKLNQISSFINKTKNVSIRKYGVQEHDIISTVKSMTKYSKLVESVNDVAYELDKAIYEALSGRMGPVWLDIPSDIQHAEMPEQYETFKSQAKNLINNNQLSNVLNIINQYNRPIVLGGYGVILSNTSLAFKNFVEKNNLPFVTTYLGIEILGYEHSLNIGTIGIKGSRSGNFAIQNCDCLLILGCSLNSSHTGYDENLFSPNSYKIMVDVDENEYNKFNNKINKFIKMDLKDFFYE
jgi:acetolactate synthase-1/2/3 large subunit